MVKALGVAVLLLLSVLASTPLWVMQRPAQATLFCSGPIDTPAGRLLITMDAPGQFEMIDYSSWNGTGYDTYFPTASYMTTLSEGQTLAIYAPGVSIYPGATQNVTVSWLVEGTTLDSYFVGQGCTEFTGVAPSGSGVCSPLPPTLILQLENGCIIPAIVNTYAWVIGLQWFIGILAALISGMIYLKSQSTWLPLILNVCLMPVCAFLLPAQLSGFFYAVFVLAIAGLFYLLFRGNG